LVLARQHRDGDPRSSLAEQRRTLDDKEISAMRDLDDHPQDGSTSLAVDANLLGLLAYLFGIVSGTIILVLEKQHREVRFHAAQSILVSIAVIILSIVTGILMPIAVLGPLVGTIVWIGSAVLWVFLLIQGFRLNHVELPILGAYAVRLADQS
jgi:uncharacterized membrane protein